MNGFHRGLAFTYPRRTLVIFATVLALAVLWLVSPFVTTLAGLLSGVIIAVAGLYLWLGGHRDAAQSEDIGESLSQMRDALGKIPTGQLVQMPMVLVLGDSLSALFNRSGYGDLVHVGQGATWLRVDNPHDLCAIALAAQQWRGGVPPDGVLISVALAQHTHVDGITQGLRATRQAVADASRSIDMPLPTFVALYQRLTRDASNATPDWYGVSVDHRPISDEHFERLMRGAEQHARRAGGAGAERVATLAALVPWTQRVVLDTLTDADLPCMPLAVQGVAWIDCGPASDSSRPWECEVAAHIGVRPAAAQASTQPWPFAQPLIAALRRRRRSRPLVRACVHAVTLLACAAVFTFWAAGRNNEILLTRVHDHLERYAAVASGHDAAKRDALQALVSDRDQLDRYARLGVPLRLSFGMYRGDPLMVPLNRAIASYVPPAPPPSVITLDSMSLFNSGHATLKPGSTKRMVDAVAMIKAHPDKRVLVAGYTDNVGSAAFNLKLSTARAEAVRDWLVEASGLSATQFAIQGYGQTRPIAPDDTDEGRAKNRRVEITLVPDLGA